MDSYTKKPTIIDLFSGCGGFSLGAELSGFHSIAAIDIDPTLQSGFRKNFPRTKAIQGNVAEIIKTDWQHIAGKSRPTGVIGGPPCQGFSRMGKRDNQDPRNDLVHHFYRHINDLRPKFFIMENVQGILDECNISILTNGIEQVSKNYNILGPFIVNAASFGAATNRFRVVVIGYDPEELPLFEISHFLPIKTPKISTIKDAIHDLPPPITASKDRSDYGWSEYIKHDIPTRLSAYAKRMRKSPPPGLGWSEAIENLKKGLVSGLIETKHSPEISTRYSLLECGKTDPISKSYKLSWNGLSPTLRAGTGSDKGSFQAVRPIHPTEGRVITVREAARIQGFPDWFVFHPTKWHSFRMIGNSVSPLMSQGLTSPFAKALFNSQNNYVA